MRAARYRRESGFGGMIVLERYIFRRMLTFVLAATLISLAIVWTVQALGKINVVTDTGQSITTFLTLAFFLLPSVVPTVVPFAVLIGVIQTLSTMNTDSELAVIAASGATRSAVFRPALLLAFGAAVFVFCDNNFLEPYSRQTVRGMVAQANSDLLSLAIKEGSFKRIEDKVYVQISGKTSDGKIEGIFVADSRDPAVDLIYFAKEAIIAKEGRDSFMLMTNGEIHRRDTKDGNLSIIRFSSYVFDLSAFMPAASGAFLFPTDRTTGYLLSPEPKDALFAKSPQLYEAELHKRATQWTYPVVFTLIALAIAGVARSHRGARVNVTMVALSIALLVRWMGLFFENMSEKNAAGELGLYLVPIIVSAIAIWSLRRQRRLRLYTLSSSIGDWIGRAYAPVRPIMQRVFPAFQNRDAESGS
jgi:lipopolysaccharide export system permease protein